MIKILDIFITFFKISSVTFGGGMAMLPILQRDIVNKKNWVTDEEVLDIYALSQGIPGIIAVNVASLIGYKKRGVFGAISAALGIVMPCLIIIIFISINLKNFQDNIYVKYSFKGISIAVTALIFNSVMNLWKKSIIDKFSLVIFSTSLIAMIIIKPSPIIIVITNCLVSILYRKREKSI